METHNLRPEPLTPAGFAPYGTVIADTADGQLFGPAEAQLELSAGVPRFYIMALERRPSNIPVLTRHRHVTQCLASVGGQEWFIVVAPPDGPDEPEALPDAGLIRAFRIPGNVGIMLNRGTWHAGPLFEAETASFFNLELTDTNQVDHHSVNLRKLFGVEYRLQI